MSTEPREVELRQKRLILRDARESIDEALACLQVAAEAYPAQLLPMIDKARARLNDLRSLLVRESKEDA